MKLAQLKQQIYAQYKVKDTPALKKALLARNIKVDLRQKEAWQRLLGGAVQMGESQVATPLHSRRQASQPQPLRGLEGEKVATPLKPVDFDSLREGTREETKAAIDRLQEITYLLRSPKVEELDFKIPQIKPMQGRAYMMDLLRQATQYLEAYNFPLFPQLQTKFPKEYASYQYLQKLQTAFDVSKTPAEAVYWAKINGARHTEVYKMLKEIA